MSSESNNNVPPTADLKNFRPVSNLAYLGKLIERIAAARLNEHMSENNLHEMLQSAYKQYTSTETAMLKIKHDILCALDNKKCVMLILLNLLAAFDTVDHNILLHRLATRVGVVGDALAWFESHITNRTQAINITTASTVWHSKRICAGTLSLCHLYTTTW